MSVPNQNIITIHREYPKTNFLQIKNENWQNALLQTNVDYPALALYLYLASNKDNYKLELSPQAIQNAIGMPKTTYYRKLQLLKDKGYIIEKSKSRLEFYEVPQRQDNVKSNLSQEQKNLSATQQNPQQRQNSSPQKQNFPQQNREIYNKYIKNNTDTTDIINNSRVMPPFKF